MITPVMDYPKTLNTVEYRSVDIITGGVMCDLTNLRSSEGVGGAGRSDMKTYLSLGYSEHKPYIYPVALSSTR